MMGTTTPLIMVLDQLDAAAAADIRLAVRELVRAAGVDEAASSAALLTTELVAGGFERGARALILYAECDTRHVRVEVGDAFRSGGAPNPSGGSEVGAIRRRLLDALCDGWGSVVSHDCELVWFDVGIRSVAR
jgi:hypothetical protein